MAGNRASIIEDVVPRLRTWLGEDGATSEFHYSVGVESPYRGAAAQQGEGKCHRALRDV